MILKVENTSEHKYDQQYSQSNRSNIISNMVAAIKTMKSVILSEQPEQYNQ